MASLRKIGYFPVGFSEAVTHRQQPHSATPPMTFEFHNIGPVEDARLELGDLTIIAGRNNTGKTYLVYALYGFLKHWAGWPGTVDFFFRNTSSSAARWLHLTHLHRQLARTGHARVRVDRSALAAVQIATLEALARDFSGHALPTVFSSSPDQFNGASLSVVMDSTDDQFTDRTVEMTLSSIGRLVLEYDGSSLSVGVKPTSTPRSSIADLSPLPSSHLRESLSYMLLRFLCPSPNPFILSAERFGISLFYKELDFAKSHVVDLLQKMGRNKEQDDGAPFLLIDKNTSRYAQPIKDNIDFTRNINDAQRRKSPLADHKLFADIRNIMGGYYQSSKDAIRFRSTARGKHNFVIPLHLASSSARGLADLYFYLRHRARPNDLLIIDEPESHLDTWNQVLLARMLVRFVKVGIKVLITTHSDYLIKEFNNLIMLSKLNHLDEFAKHDNVLKQRGYSESDGLSGSSVRAYVAEQHRLHTATIDDYGMNMKVFDDTIDSINHTSNRLATLLQHSLRRHDDSK